MASENVTSIAAVYNRAGRRGPLDPTGGGPHDPGMEQRISRLEADVTEIKTDMKAMRSTLDQMKGRLDAMPTSVQLFGLIFVVLAAGGILKYFG